MELKDYELEDYKKIKLVIAAARMHTNGKIAMNTMGQNPSCSVNVEAATLEKLLKELS